MRHILSNSSQGGQEVGRASKEQLFSVEGICIDQDPAEVQGNNGGSTGMNIIHQIKGVELNIGLLVFPASSQNMFLHRNRGVPWMAC
jgi:hypothetical protein